MECTLRGTRSAYYETHWIEVYNQKTLMNPTQADLLCKDVGKKIFSNQQADSYGETPVREGDRLRILYEISTDTGAGLDEQIENSLKAGVSMLDLDIGIVSERRWKWASRHLYSSRY